ncbi:aldolase [Piscirickettsia salmonis]|uniref:L-fuculose phosphate aldolase n=1 Tax=Piscirickettsia salmonis TaxID=1238 RepID=A0A9Q6PS09_PISSA|nr:class II aldolase/adducin family protein [Piscirickettsia salmonis]RNC78005.1 aldolase [Piscirickettsiaceae bacterium NZ-RLO2]ALA24302.1 class II Aldolase and Adducin N-terminal domain protein [Piscirickettsia salmonis]APS44681.1 aldolase [Piscirickettsia salmonis]APS48041.1 aldolase [Piscirickettsia salmonis]APS51998.1 aldolase [Piscirickettsia salmonis]
MTEKELRIQLAAAHRLLALFGWEDLVSTHLTIYLPESDQMLATPYGLLFDEIRASDIVRIDREGYAIGESGYSVVGAGVTIHNAVYDANPHNRAAIHTHSIYGTAVSSLECGLLFTNQHCLRFYEQVAYHEFAGLAFNVDERAPIASALTDKPVMIFKNHGLLAVGSSIVEAFYYMYYLEKACELQIKTLSAGKAIVPISHQDCLLTARQFKEVCKPQMVFDALLRKLDRIDDSYRN